MMSSPNTTNVTPLPADLTARATHTVDVPLPIGASLERPVGCRLSHTPDEQSGAVLGDPTPPQCVSHHPSKNKFCHFIKNLAWRLHACHMLSPKQAPSTPKKRANATSDSDIKVRGPTKLNLNKCRTGFTQLCKLATRTWTGQWNHDGPGPGKWQQQWT